MGALTTVLEVFGLLFVVLGAGLIYIPAGVILFGLFLVLTGYLLSNPPVPPAIEDHEL